MQFCFDNHTLDTERRELLRGGDPVALQPQVFDLLVHLVQNRDRVVSKDDLIALVWGGRIVSELDPDQPHQRHANRRRRQRQAPATDPHHSAQGRTLRRRCDRASRRRRAGRRGGEVAEPPRALPVPDRPAIAVLAFDNMSGDREQEYFSDGISEDIITALSQVRWVLRDRAQLVLHLQGQAVHLSQVAEELGVRYVVEGSVRKDGAPRPHHGAAQRCRYRQSHLGGAL